MKKSAKPRIAPTRCLSCNDSIPSASQYTFFCSKTCAANWGDDEALMQWLAAHDKRKKAKDFMERSGISIEHSKEKANT